MVLDQLMVDGLKGPTDAANVNKVVLAEGRNLFVQSSLICGIEGGETVFKSHAYDGDGHSVQVVNSAMWQLGQSPLDLEVNDGAPEGSPVVVANVTFHHASDTPLPLVLPGGDDEDEPLLSLQNSYLQGVWGLGGVADGSDVIATVVGVEGGESSDCETRWGEGCTVTTTQHLDPDYAEQPCGIAMDNLVMPLLDEVDTEARMRPARHLKDLMPAVLDDTPDLERPALRRITVPEAGAACTLPDAEREWGDSEWCWSHLGDESPEIGGGSVQVSGLSDTENLCSLPLLEPYDVPDDQSEDSGYNTVDEGTDSGASPESQAPDGLAAAASYGLATGCRYSVAAVWLVLPLGLARRRRSSTST